MCMNVPAQIVRGQLILQDWSHGQFVSPLTWALGTKLGLLEARQALLTAEPSLQLLFGSLDSYGSRDGLTSTNNLESGRVR